MFSCYTTSKPHDVATVVCFHFCLLKPRPQFSPPCNPSPIGPSKLLLIFVFIVWNGMLLKCYWLAFFNPTENSCVHDSDENNVGQVQQNTVDSAWRFALRKRATLLGVWETQTSGKTPSLLTSTLAIIARKLESNHLWKMFCLRLQ